MVNDRVLSPSGPHVRYIQKPDNRPCSITDSVKRFPVEEASEGNATSPPQNPPSNLTVVTVEGCPSFVILDWEKPPNDTVTGKITEWGLLLWLGSFDNAVHWGLSQTMACEADLRNNNSVYFCCPFDTLLSKVSYHDKKKKKIIFVLVLSCLLI